MLGFTAAVGGTAAHLSRKGLRGSAEALWALVAALLMLDLRAGYASGLFGLDQLSTRSVLTLAGGLLVALGGGVALWAQRTRIGRCVAAECTMVAGVLLVTAVQGWSTTGVDGLREAIAVPVLVGLGLLLRDRLRDASYAVTGIGVLTWVLLAANGVSRGARGADPGRVLERFRRLAAAGGGRVRRAGRLRPHAEPGGPRHRGRLDPGRVVPPGAAARGVDDPRGAAPRRGGPRVRRPDPVRAGALVHGRVGARRDRGRGRGSGHGAAPGRSGAGLRRPARGLVDRARRPSSRPSTTRRRGRSPPWCWRPWPSSPPWCGATSSSSACCWRWVRSCWPWPPRPAWPAPVSRCGWSWPRSEPSPWSASSPPSCAAVTARWSA